VRNTRSHSSIASTRVSSGVRFQPSQWSHTIQTRLRAGSKTTERPQGVFRRSPLGRRGWPRVRKSRLSLRGAESWRSEYPSRSPRS
jgi:hypothetical protein